MKSNRYQFTSQSLPFRIGLAAILFFLAFPSVAQTFDLKADWSDSANPNGVWLYRAGSTVLPHVTSWPVGGFVSQQGWANGSSLPFWFQSTETPSFAHDWQTGDVVVHTQDDFNGSGNGTANVVWVSPISGTIDITGGVWEGRDIGSFGGGLRGNQWNLYVKGQLVSTGTISGGDPYSRANPFTFSLGSGGPIALNDIPVALGDTVTLELVRTSVDGDFVGVNLAIAAVPEPSQAALLAVGVFTLLTVSRRSRTRIKAHDAAA
jgi:hypothetical protein